VISRGRKNVIGAEIIMLKIKVVAYFKAVS
jgi:hypothetical protein